MKIRPSKRYFIFQIPFKLLAAFFLSYIPLLLLMFVWGTIQQWGMKVEYGLLIGIYLLFYVFIAGWMIISDYLYYHSSYLESDDEGVTYLESGFSRSHGTWPYASIEYGEVAQSFMGRLLNLSTIFITTKNEEEDVVFRGYRYADAEKFIDTLQNKFAVKVHVKKK